MHVQNLHILFTTFTMFTNKNIADNLDKKCSGDETKLKSHYRGHKLAIWLNLVDKLSSADQTKGEFGYDEDNLYAGITSYRIVELQEMPNHCPLWK